MRRRAPRSLRHEYELFVEREIEHYKESLPRSALLKLGDEAVALLARQSQLTLTEVVLCEEVDRLIRQRLRLPSYTAWRKRRLAELEELRRPEHWGLRPEDLIVRAFAPVTDGQVLVAGTGEGAPALYLAANGCDVTTLHRRAEIIERVLDAAEAAGLTGRVRAEVGRLEAFHPVGPLAAVICTLDAFEGLSPEERERVLDILQEATARGGVHMVEAMVTDDGAVWLEELASSYIGWEISVEREVGPTRTFIARKAVA